jgi:hypothetical protein
MITDEKDKSGIRMRNESRGEEKRVEYRNGGLSIHLQSTCARSKRKTINKNTSFIYVQLAQPQVRDEH